MYAIISSEPLAGLRQAQDGIGDSGMKYLRYYRRVCRMWPERKWDSRIENELMTWKLGHTKFEYSLVAGLAQ